MSTAAIGGSRAASIDGSTTPTTASGSSSLLAEPVSDPATAVMQMMVKLHQDQKAADRLDEHAEEQAMVAENEKRVQEMHEKAADIMSEGIVGGVMGITAGALSMTS